MLVKDKGNGQRLNGKQVSVCLIACLISYIMMASIALITYSRETTVSTISLKERRKSGGDCICSLASSEILLPKLIRNWAA